MVALKRVGLYIRHGVMGFFVVTGSGISYQYAVVSEM